MKTVEEKKKEKKQNNKERKSKKKQTIHNFTKQQKRFFRKQIQNLYYLLTQLYPVYDKHINIYILSKIYIYIKKSSIEKEGLVLKKVFNFLAVSQT